MDMQDSSTNGILYDKALEGAHDDDDVYLISFDRRRY